MPVGFYKFVVHNVKELELLLMHNRCPSPTSMSYEFRLTMEVS